MNQTSSLFFIDPTKRGKYREELQGMIARKMSEASAAPAIEKRAAPRPVVDILTALKKNSAQKEHRDGS
jgi:non-homologous end joining protein Ku